MEKIMSELNDPTHLTNTKKENLPNILAVADRLQMQLRFEKEAHNTDGEVIPAYVSVHIDGDRSDSATRNFFEACKEVRRENKQLAEKYAKELAELDIQGHLTYPSVTTVDVEDEHDLQCNDSECGRR
jgi:hypothetical protein